MADVPKSVVISERGLVIDGEDFPWYLAPSTMTITVTPDAFRTLAIEMLLGPDTEVTV